MIKPTIIFAIAWLFWIILLFTLSSIAANAGDSVPTPGIVELLIPTVNETEDFGELFAQLPSRRFTDDVLFDLLAQDKPLPDPAPIPVPASFYMLLTALLLLKVRYAIRTRSLG